MKTSPAIVVQVQSSNAKIVKELKAATPGSSGVDLQANCGEAGAMTIRCGETLLVPTGLKVAIPEGYELQIRPRSGLALKHGITVLNTPGTIDSDYRGEIGVILINHGERAFQFGTGTRIAQAVLTKVEKISWKSVKDLTKTKRGEGGFGSTGTTGT